VPADPAEPGDRQLEAVVTRHVAPIVPADGGGGAAAALRIGGRTLFFNYGLAERSSGRPIDADTLFNLASLRKVFEATLLAQAAGTGEVKLEDPVAKYVVELRHGGAIRRVTLLQLATHTSGLLLPQDHPPWPDWGYSLPQFIATLNAWRPESEPGQRHLYTHAGYVLLQLALERRLGAPMDELLQRRILRPLGLGSTSLPRRDESPRGQLSPEDRQRAVQGYADDGTPIGEPGDQQGYYHWPATSQMYSSPRDMAVFLAANLGELPIEPALRQAMALAQQSVLTIGPHNRQALAWEIISGEGPTIVEKYGGLDNASAYIGMLPGRDLGVVILGNRGNQYPNEVGRRLLLELASR
jgi:beta-lactamase class C